MENITVAQAFPPGDFIKEELEARGWSQQSLAEIMARQTSVVSAIVNGKRGISLDIATELSSAFGTSVDYWMNLEKSYQQFMRNRPDDSISRRARLFQLAPVKEMAKRNWIEPSTDWAVIEKQVCAFLEIQSLDEEPKAFAHAAKKSSPEEPATPAQAAWLRRAKKLARAVQAAQFSEESFADAVRSIRRLMENPEDVRQVPKVLAAAGIRLLIVENIAHAKMDGACFWLDNQPVIAMGVRYDRIENFWYVLTHEMGHVGHRDGVDGDPVWDANLVGEDAVPFEQKSEMEKRADIFAQETLIDQAALENWITRIGPLYSKVRILAFARMNHVHPAIVLGQLQHRKEVDWSHSREMLVKFRHLITPVALTDGFGNVLPANL
ncbi:MAG: helix-turn-helix domain-containing protein [Terriglobia bacterium]